jgi:hypothetical protein
MCHRCLGVGRVFYGSDTEGGREETVCECRRGHFTVRDVLVDVGLGVDGEGIPVVGVTAMGICFGDRG